MDMIARFLDSRAALVLGVGLLLGMVLVAELGAARRRRIAVPGETLYAAAAAVSLLGLLIGFTFNVALNRYDERRDLVVEEAAAITMAWERSALLPPAARDAVQPLLRRYVDQRRVYFQQGLATDRQRAPDMAGRLVRQQLWDVVEKAEASGEKALMVRAFLDAMNRIDDAAASRESMAREHIPVTVVVALALVSLITAASLGFAGAAAGPSARRGNIGFCVCVTLALMVVIDLDRPRSGLVMVSQQPMRDLEAVIDRQA